MEENQVINQERLDQIKEMLLNLRAKSFDDSMIRDNKIIFSLNEATYRCRMPSQKEITYANSKIEEAYIKLINEGVCIKERDLKAKLKEKQGIDIDAMEAKKKELQFLLEIAYVDLALVNPANEDEIILRTNKIKEIEKEHSRIFIDIMEYLSPSLENKREKIYIEYVTYMCTEKLVSENPDTWEQLWKNYKEFEDTTDQRVLAETVGAMTFLLLRVNR